MRRGLKIALALGMVTVGIAAALLFRDRTPPPVEIEEEPEPTWESSAEPWRVAQVSTTTDKKTETKLADPDPEDPPRLLGHVDLEDMSDEIGTRDDDSAAEVSEARKLPNEFPAGAPGQAQPEIGQSTSRGDRETPAALARFPAGAQTNAAGAAAGETPPGVESPPAGVAPEAPKKALPGVWRPSRGASKSRSGSKTYPSAQETATKQVSGANASDPASDSANKSDEPKVSPQPRREGRTTRHRVRDGDTLASLAEEFLGDASEFMVIYRANQDRLSAPDVLPIGVNLTIPLPDGTPPGNAAPDDNDPDDNVSEEADRHIAESSQDRASRGVKVVGRRSYRVVEGDTLASIARRFYGDASRSDELLRANAEQLKSADDPRPGMTLRVP